MAGINVQIGADTDELDAALKKSKSQIRDFGKELGNNAKQAAKWGAAAVAAATAASAVIVRNSLKSIDALAKTSDKLGIAIADLQGLRKAAELSGVGVNTLDMGLQRMVRRVSEAAQGTGEAQDAIAELGLSAEDLARLAPDEQFKAIAGAMENVGEQTEKVRLAFKIFDSEGVSLVNTLAMGEQGLRDIRDEMDELGASITRIDAARIEEANNAMLRVATAAEGLSTQLTVELADSITAVANTMVGEFKRGSDSMSDGISNAVDVAVFGFADVLDGAAEVMDFISKNPMTSQFGVLGFVFLGPKGKAIITALGVVFDFVSKEMAKLGVTTTQAQADAINLLDVRQRIAEQEEIINRARSNRPDGAPDTEFIKQNLEALEDLREMEQNLSESVEGSSEAQDNYNELLRQGTDDADNMAGATRRLADALRQSREQAAAGLGQVLGGPGIDTPGVPGGDEGFSEGLEERLEKIREANLTEMEILREKEAQELEILREAKDAKLILDQEFQEQLTDTEQRYADARQKIKEQEEAAKYAAMHSALGNMSTLMNTESRKMFEVGKAASTAQAIIKGWEAATSAWAAGMSTGGPYAPVVAAAYTAASLAKTGAQIQAIQSASFGGGGRSGGGGGGASVTQSVNNQGEAVQGQSSSNQNITLQGVDPNSLFTGRQLIDVINQAQQDGAILQVQS